MSIDFWSEREMYIYIYIYLYRHYLNSKLHTKQIMLCPDHMSFMSVYSTDFGVIYLSLYGTDSSRLPILQSGAELVVRSWTVSEERC